MAAGVWAGFGATAHSGGETRTLSLYHVHTRESLNITYMKDGKYIPSAIKKINYLMRDWRRNEVIKMDPRTIDLMWELHADLGSKRPIHIVCGYRSPRTNAFLKKIGRNVARKSQHMVGHAIDLYFPDIPTEKIRNSALVRKVGGVGYYRSGGGPTGFLHIDSGNVRHWGPAISSSQMARIMRDYKKTVGARRGKAGMIAVPEPADDGLPTSDGPFQQAELKSKSKAKKQKIPLETAYTEDDDELAQLSSDASKSGDKAKPVAEAAGEAPEGVVKAYPVPKPRPKPIEVLMMAAVNMKIEPASAPPPDQMARQKPSPVSDSIGVVISAETMAELSADAPTSNAAAKGSLATELRDGTASGVPMIRTLTASAAGDDLFWWPTQVIFNSDKAVRVDGAPQRFGDTVAGLLPGVDEAEAAEPAPALPRLAVAAMPELASGKGDMLVVNRQGKGSLMEDAPALKARKLKVGQLITP
ncbi:MAG: DUF882 domain-containing protein [Alphaproteobacteria bacterium]|nr:DUF882 domain-containing protein [Alphaproteobacteria bacterium]